VASLKTITDFKNSMSWKSLAGSGYENKPESIVSQTVRKEVDRKVNETTVLAFQENECNADINRPWYKDSCPKQAIHSIPTT
jgi:hypothetical protein